MKKSRRLPRRKAIPGSDDESGHDSKATSEAREALKSMMDLDDGMYYLNLSFFGVSMCHTLHR